MRFKNSIVEWIVLLLIGLALVENIFYVVVLFDPIRGLMLLFMALMLYLYSQKSIHFKACLQVWACLILFTTSIGIVSSVLSLTPSTWGKIILQGFTIIIGFFLFYVSSKYVVEE